MGGNHISSRDSKEQTLMIMIMIVNIIYNPAGIPIKLMQMKGIFTPLRKWPLTSAGEVRRPYLSFDFNHWPASAG
jgi:hypothetical protein